MARVIFGNDAVETFNVCLGTSFRFHKKLGLQTENVCLFVCFRLCAMYAFYHLYVCLSFRANLMLCINYL